MMFIVSFALSLLVLSAGLFLLIRSRDGLGKFFKVMAWIIIGFGIIITLVSIQMAAFRCISHCCKNQPCKENVMMFNDQDGPCAFKCGPGMGDKENCKGNCRFKCDMPGGMKMKFFEKYIDDDEEEGLEAEEVIKVISDSIKLTPEQEKKIKEAVENALK